MSRVTAVFVVVIAAAYVVTTSPHARADSIGDPMRPAGARGVAATRVAPKASRVTAVFVSGERRVAVFDGRVVRSGDRVGDAVILEVLDDGVRFAQSGRVEVARLVKQAVAIRREPVVETKTASVESQENEP